MKKDDYISLREAAAISGYSPDYVGQLIRSGKLPGKQVVSHVAWMTTEEALKEYMNKKSAGKQSSSHEERFTIYLRNLIAKMRRQFEMPRLLTKLLYAVIAITVCFLLLLFYIFSASLERELNQKAMERAAAVGAIQQ